jgi:hypothetical protein
MTGKESVDKQQLFREDTAADPCETKTKIINGTKFTIEYRYVGEKTLLDIIKNAIKRDIENGS